ncbi:MAG TPA: hypothetical protein VLM43_20075 [Desulfobacterales bacterium]|nr:hypothetical protein [Desulfobacterales bacterium]
MGKRGRPKLSENDKKAMKYNKAINVRITEDQKGKIDVVARKNNQSVQQFMRHLINNEISKYEWI